MKRGVLTLVFDATDEYCENEIIPFGKMLESGDFHKKFTEGIEGKLTIIDAKLEITNKQETNE